MKILFVLYMYYKPRDPAGNCVKVLRENLRAMGVESDVLTIAWEKGLPKKVSDESGNIYLAQSFMRNARLKKDDSGKISMGAFDLFSAAFARGLAYSLGGAYKEQGMPDAYAKGLGLRLKELCSKNGYDAVVSVSYPFAIHRCVLKYAPENVLKALFNFDPYYANVTYSQKRSVKRMLKEIEAYEKADIIFATPEQKADFSGTAFDGVRNKIKHITYPNMQPKKEGCQCESIIFDKNDINCVFLGTIYADIRRPDALFKLFTELMQREKKIRLFVIGNKFGAGSGEFLEKYKALLGERLVLSSAVAAQEVGDIIDKADILVNIGNTNLNQLPSKVVEYIASGKPVLNFCQSKKCNSLPYFERYPLCYSCFRGEEESPSVVAEALAFIRENKGKRLNFTEISELYPDMSAEGVAKTFKTALEEKLDSIVKRQ